MSLTAKTLVCTTVVCPNANGVAPLIAVPDNCHTVIVLNPAGNPDVLMAQEAPGTALSQPGNATRIAAGSSLVLGIGTISERGVLAFDAAAGTTGFVYGSAGQAVTPTIMYLCSFGAV
jgi:hypothetical protein